MKYIPIPISQEVLAKFNKYTVFVVLFQTTHYDWCRVFSTFESAAKAFNDFVIERPSSFEDCEVFDTPKGFAIINAYGSTSCKIIAKILE